MPHVTHIINIGFLQIKRYYHFKVKHTDIYSGLKPSKEANIFQSNILVVFPHRDQLGRRILVIELGSMRHITPPPPSPHILIQ